MVNNTLNHKLRIWSNSTNYVSSRPTVHMLRDLGFTVTQIVDTQRYKYTVFLEIHCHTRSSFHSRSRDITVQS